MCSRSDDPSQHDVQLPDNENKDIDWTQRHPDPFGTTKECFLVFDHNHPFGPSCTTPGHDHRKPCGCPANVWCACTKHA